MRQRLITLLIPGLLLIATGCGQPADTPTPFPTATPSPLARRETATPSATAGPPTATPIPYPVEKLTPRPTETPLVYVPEEVLAHFDRARQLIQRRPLAEPHSDAAAEIVEGVRLYLEQVMDPTKPLEEQDPRFLEQLNFEIPIGPKRGTQIARPADLDGDGWSELLVPIDFYGTPAFVFRYDGEGYVPYQIPPQPLRQAGQPEVQRVEDINADGRPEIVLTYVRPGSGSATVRLYIVQWAGDHFTTLLAVRMNNWLSRLDWKLEPGPSDALDVVVRCLTFGVYDAKPLAHQQQTRTFRWTGDAYALVSEETEPPRTRRQQVNVAEAAFQRGDYTEAITAYQKAAEDEGLSEDAQTRVDWRAYAVFRSGQLHALLGQAGQARQALSTAREAGPLLDSLATAFLEAYQDGDVAAAWAALQKTDLHGKVEQGEAGNLGAPMDPLMVLYPSIAVTAYLNGDENRVDAGPEALASAMEALGLPLPQVVLADVDGDGQQEAVFIITSSGQDSAWVADRQSGQWVPHLLARAAEVHLEETVPISNQPLSALVFRLPAETGFPQPTIMAWDGQQATYLHDTTSLEPALEEMFLPPSELQCGLP